MRNGNLDRVEPVTSLAELVPWLLSAKVTVPARTVHFLDRPSVLADIDLEAWPLIMVRAPGGFGKTTLLAEICRREGLRGVLSAWLTLDEDDTEEGVGLYLLYAFESAGLGVKIGPDAEAHGVELLLDAIDSHHVPCLLVLDEVERLAGRAVETVNFILQHAPPNLRIVIGMRENPGLDLSTVVLDGRAIELGADRLRFSQADIRGYFGDVVTRSELAEIEEQTVGWPFAVSLYRKLRLGDGQPDANRVLPMSLEGDEGVAANWLGARLMRGVVGEQRRFLLELAQFDWIDVGVVDEVLARRDSGRRIADLRMLGALIQPLGGKERRRSLHPLLKEYCVGEFKREDPGEYRQLHRLIATAMFKRGHLLSAVRHAGETRDTDLLGQFLVEAGGLRLALREGFVQLGAAVPLLTEEVVERYPRVALLQSWMLLGQSMLVEARARYEAVRVRTNDFKQDRADGDDAALELDGLLVGGLLMGYGCVPYTNGLVDRLTVRAERLIARADSDPAAIACKAILLFGAHHQMARFERGQLFADEARQNYELLGSPYGATHVALHCGITAVARGRTRDAEGYFETAAGLAERHSPFDPQLRRIAQTLAAELDLERNRAVPAPRQETEILAMVRNQLVWFDVVVAASEVVVEMRFLRGGGEAALKTIQTLRDGALASGLVRVERHLAGLEVSYLAGAGRVDEARRVWRDAALPELVESEDPSARGSDGASAEPSGLAREASGAIDDDHAGLTPGGAVAPEGMAGLVERNLALLDLDSQTWREMESVACARIRLSLASGGLEEARSLAMRLMAVARERDLRRTLMRGLTLAMAVEQRDSRLDSAQVLLMEYLRLLPETEYYRPAVREKAVVRRLLDALPKDDLEPELRECAELLSRQIETVVEPAKPQFSQRERDILALIRRGQRDKEIARLLDLTVDGVRYHLKNVYRKVGATSRSEAVRLVATQADIE